MFYLFDSDTFNFIYIARFGVDHTKEGVNALHIGKYIDLNNPCPMVIKLF